MTSRDRRPSGRRRALPALLGLVLAAATAGGVAPRASNEKHGELPHPATMVIDRGGVIRFLPVDEDYKVRPATARVLQALEDLR